MNRYLLLVVIAALTITAHSQRRDISLKEYFADAEFFFLEEEYVDALQDYLEVSKRDYQDNANINYKIGVCYLNIPNQKDKAIQYLLKACEKTSDKYAGSTLKEEYAPLDAYLYLGNAYRVLYDLEEAIDNYYLYIDLLPEQAVREKKYALKQIEAARIAGDFIENPINVGFTNLGSLINTSNANHNCVVSADTSVLVFMTKLPFYEAIFMSRRRGKNWSRPINITPQLMSDGDQFVTGVSADGNTLLLVKEDIFDSDIYISTFENGKWEKSKPIGKTINSRFWESHASFSRDGKTLYFTSNRIGGIGDMDIYSSSLQENGNWGSPVNLGKNINTEFNEDTPFITADGKSLYFSSQGHKSMGGYDFFVSHVGDSGWAGAENLLYPLSTSDEDLFYFPWKNGEEAYVQKIFEDGKGHWDIYHMEFLEEVEIEESLTDQIIEDVEEEAELQVPKKERIEVEVTPILFAFDNSKLTPSAERVISGFVVFLNEYPESKLKIIGHTDNLGSDVYNLRLSERRANSAKNYIVERGVSPEKIEAAGMGETLFIAKNTTETGADSPEGRKYNRRVEFEIIGIDEDLLLPVRVTIVPEKYRLDK